LHTEDYNNIVTYLTIRKENALSQKTIFDDFKSLIRLILSPEKHSKEITFYSSQGQYISYFVGLIKALTIDHGYQINYLTSDPNDPIFNQDNEKITPHYIKKFLSILLPLLETKIIVMTMPDIHQYHLKRSFSGTNYIYLFHAIVSTHMMYRKGAFDHYDTIFCVGPHHVEEIRQTEKANDLTSKTLHKIGYYRLEKIFNDHMDYLSKGVNDPKTILIAPGWQPSNILETCGEQLIEELIKGHFNVVVRPHPMTIANNMKLLFGLKERFMNFDNFQLDLETASEDYIHSADVMICDWSGVAIEYAFGTERPVLFIDLPKKIYNPDYLQLGITPLEVQIRNIIGKTIQPEDVTSVREILEEFISQKNTYSDQIRLARENYIYNFGSSSQIGCKIIIEILENNIRGKVKA